MKSPALTLSFVKMNPSGNTTILITDSVDRSLHGLVARTLMEPLYLCAEQVGFVEEPTDPRAAARLQMMAGEFCGNASRAVAALLADRGGGPRGGDSVTITLEVSGSDSLVEARVTPTGPESWWTDVQVPGPRAVRETTAMIAGKPVTAFCVTLPGIEHVVLDRVSPALELYEALLEQRLFSADSDARGVMFWDSVEGTVVPLVAVGSETLVWEGSCGSGSVAVASVAAQRMGQSVNNLVLRQPHGELTVSVRLNEQGCTHPSITGAVIKGPVERIASGQVTLPAGS